MLVTVTVAEAGEIVVLQASVTVIVYTVVETGLTVIEEVVAPPGDHEYVYGDFPPEAVVLKVAVPLPAHKLELLGAVALSAVTVIAVTF